MDRKDNGLVLIHEPCIMPVMISFASFFFQGGGEGGVGAQYILISVTKHFLAVTK